MPAGEWVPEYAAVPEILAAKWDGWIHEAPLSRIPGPELSLCHHRSRHLLPFPPIEKLLSKKNLVEICGLCSPHEIRPCWSPISTECRVSGPLRDPNLQRGPAPAMHSRCTALSLNNNRLKYAATCCMGNKHSCR